MGTSCQRGPCDRIAIIAATLKRTRGVYDDEGGLGYKPVSEIVRVRVQLSGAAGGVRAKALAFEKLRPATITSNRASEESAFASFPPNTPYPPRMRTHLLN